MIVLHSRVNVRKSPTIYFFWAISHCYNHNAFNTVSIFKKTKHKLLAIWICDCYHHAIYYCTYVCVLLWHHTILCVPLYKIKGAYNPFKFYKLPFVFLSFYVLCNLCLYVFEETINFVLSYLYTNVYIL